ncbi:MAG: 4-phosphoerythronate dehydrogenase [Lentisphaerae bacterium]|jgi:erythronate-4-phosphate dehydrogenase|nr:4-phosphoerythronate dehydrogenase [Lentisphaerota bacterium]
MKIVCDVNMPFVREAFATLGDVLAVDGRAISPAHLQDADVLITRSTTRVDEALIGSRRLRFYGSGVIGTDHIDDAFLARAGIPWQGAPGCNAASVAQYIVSALVRLALRYNLRLDTLTLGVVGVGHVGRQVWRQGCALGMRVIGCDPPRRRNPHDAGAQAFVPLETLLQEADVVTLHVPLTRQGEDATWHMIDAARLACMRPGTFLINAARGPVLDSDAWLAARGRLGGTILDTWEPEPAYRPEVLQHADWGTPHIAGHSFEGKANGTMMVYEAACRVLGVAPAYTPAMPPPPVPELTIDARGLSREALLEKLALPVYDLAHDDAGLRATAVADDHARAKAFDQLRRAYPMRREFTATRVNLLHATPEQHRLAAGLGFQTGQQE